MSFSGKVLLGDLDDFIAPAQACTTGLFSDNPNNAKATRQLIMEDDFNEQFGSSQANVIRTNVEKIATVSLEDCLACSGCVTSAETILIQQQSTTTFLDALKRRDHKVYVAILSRPSLVSISFKLGCSVEEAYQTAYTALKSHGVDIIVRQDMGEQIAMIETMKEFEKRKESSTKPTEITMVTSYAVNSNQSLYPTHNQLAGSIDFENLSSSSSEYSLLSNSDYFSNPSSFPAIGPNSPFITSNCPGWVCYAEKKTHALVPYLSTTCSAQQIMGVLLRKLLPLHIANQDLQARDFYITSIVSCYDRKLEASRRDYLTEEGYHTINCVLSSQELLEIIQSPCEASPTEDPGIQFDEDWWKELEQVFLTDYADHFFSSGGVLASLIAHYSFQYEETDVEMKTVRNSDFVEVSVVSGGIPLLKGAFIYGFRNIQNLVMKMKRRKCSYDVVEVMACPSGCLNGGGQIKPEKREDMLHIANDLIQKYQEHGKRFDYSEMAKHVENLYLQLGCVPGSEEAYSLFHTRFHVIPEITVNSLHW